MVLDSPRRAARLRRLPRRPRARARQSPARHLSAVHDPGQCHRPRASSARSVLTCACARLSSSPSPPSLRRKQRLHGRSLRKNRKFALKTRPPSRHRLHAQLRFGAVGIAPRGHRRRLRLVRLQQFEACPTLRRSTAARSTIPCTRIRSRSSRIRRRTIISTATTATAHFTDVTDKAGLDPDMYSIAVTAADYDNDGNEDLLVTGYGKVDSLPQQRQRPLHRRDGEGRHQGQWLGHQLHLARLRQGRLPDLFVGRYVKFDPKYRAYYAADNYPGPLDYAGETNKLFHNNCDGTFTDVTDKSGIGRYVGRTMGVTAADFTGDGWDDIYVANDSTREFSLPQQARRNIRGDRRRRRHGLRPERRVHLRHGPRVCGLRQAAACSICGSRDGQLQPPDEATPARCASTTWARPTASRRPTRNM